MTRLRNIQVSILLPCPGAWRMMRALSTGVKAVAFEMTKLVGAEFPLFAFSHCRDVVAAVSRAGGFGVLGGARFSPQSLEQELKWIDDHVDGKPYGVDILIPEHQAVKAGTSLEAMAAMLPAEHRTFVENLLRRNGIEPKAEPPQGRATTAYDGEPLLDVAFKHPIRLIANALGIAPPIMIERGRHHGVPVAALVGAKEHAIRQINAGVDVIVAQGSEAGGHCGEVSTLVLVPEVIAAISKMRKVPVLAAGGIMTGRQMAGMMAMGAAGAWTGSVWLATTDSETSEVVRDKLVAATSRDTIRSKYRTGKFSRQLRSAWHEAWETQGAPAALPMPLMSVLVEPVLQQINSAALKGNTQARELVTYFVGQGVGLIDGVKSATRVVQDFKEDFADAMSTVMAWSE
jgi:NAD(P)H-dependent flavin oxidoreductase YrpB (nitropropane dioxygenase family)